MLTHIQTSRGLSILEKTKPFIVNLCSENSMRTTTIIFLKKLYVVLVLACRIEQQNFMHVSYVVPR